MDQIRSMVRQLLAKAKINTPPVEVEKVAKQQKVKVKFAALEGNISGLLFRKQGRAVIGVNALHPPVRQRFTLAHELGHFLLGHRGDFFLPVILFRDSKSQEGTHEEEISANRFAAELLMPEDMVRKELKNHSIELDDEEAVEKLAAKFRVSTQAMTIRLQYLGRVSIGDEF